MFQIETISAKMLDYYVERNDTIIIDLRAKEEYRNGHLKSAISCPFEELEGYKSFPQGKLLIFYCDRGGASMRAAKMYAQRGYKTRSVIGGFEAYRGRNLVISS